MIGDRHLSASRTANAFATALGAVTLVACSVLAPDGLSVDLEHEIVFFTDEEGYDTLTFSATAEGEAVVVSGHYNLTHGYDLEASAHVTGTTVVLHLAPRSTLRRGEAGFNTADTTVYTATIQGLTAGSYALRVEHSGEGRQERRVVHEQPITLYTAE